MHAQMPDRLWRLPGHWKPMFSNQMLSPNKMGGRRLISDVVSALVHTVIKSDGYSLQAFSVPVTYSGTFIPYLP